MLGKIRRYYGVVLNILDGVLLVLLLLLFLLLGDDDVLELIVLADLKNIVVRISKFFVWIIVVCNFILVDLKR